ncbi:hypothetical protein TNCV_4990231 [Trichonephila clavipes]|uniref:Uncharacterized protein n=1 Tax=Trichonephila clavipes TaxID=2585209 RepID=A0A8X6WAZ5_TRICX|nr:hypothetical protein TNCV_4990231 [Trichonephila clavipes]
MKKKKEKRLTNSKFIVNFLKVIKTQTYPSSEEFETVVKDDDATNVDSEKELPLEQKLDLVITKKISLNLSTIQKSDVSKIRREREIDLFEDGGFRDK